MFYEKEALNRLSLGSEIWQLSDQSYFYGSPWTQAQFENDLFQAGTQYLLFFEEEQLIGFISYYSALEEVDITHVVIGKEYQRQGYGKKLLNELVVRLAKQGKDRLFLEVRGSNIPAIRAYETFGFKQMSSRKNYYQQPQEDALIMCYKIRK